MLLFLVVARFCFWSVSSSYPPPHFTRLPVASPTQAVWVETMDRLFVDLSCVQGQTCDFLREQLQVYVFCFFFLDFLVLVLLVWVCDAAGTLSAYILVARFPPVCDSTTCLVTATWSHRLPKSGATTLHRLGVL